jgi:alpha-galactosidase
MRITIVGGGSAQWVPLLADDIVAASFLAGCELVLHDIDDRKLARTAAYANHVAALTGTGVRVRATTALDEALQAANYVVVCISTGGLESMARDLDVSARFGVPMPVGDTVGPAGISRALRNIPVMLDIAHAMERCCPDAWMINVTNPLTALTQAVAREKKIKVVGLCHELVGCRFFVAQMLDADFYDVEINVVGVNHFPLVCEVECEGIDETDRLHAIANGYGDLSTPLPMLDRVMAQPVATTGGTPDDAMRASGWTKQRLRDMLRLNYEVLRCFGSLPGAHPNHTIEFMPGFLTKASDWGKRWGVEHTTIADRRVREAGYVARLEEGMRQTEPPRGGSTEMVVDVILGLETGKRVVRPMNIPNRGRFSDFPDSTVVETNCIADKMGIRARDLVSPSLEMTALLQRIVESQHLTIEAAVGGDEDDLLAALFTDPLAGSIDHDALIALRDAIIDETREWLPQFH